MNKSKRILDLTLSKKTDLIKLVLAAFILALGTSLLANYITDYFKNNLQVILFLGLFLIIIVIIYFIYNIIKEAQNEIEIEGLVAIENKTNVVCPILRYEFSETLSDTMNAVFLENEAIKQHWDEDFKKKNQEKEKEKEKEKNDNLNTSNNVKKDKIGYFSIVRVTGEDAKREKTKADKILEETVEYLILEQLSTHLSTYFNDYSEQDKVIKEYTRNDFPEILLQNRIVNLLSTPFEDRAIFIKAGMTTNPPNGEVVAIYGDDGSRFSRFDLFLPKGSIVKRPSNGLLTVENNRIFLQIEINFENFASTLPKGFEQNYLGLNPREIETKKIDIKLKYRIKPKAIFFGAKWNYYNWVDSFADRLVEYFCFDTFIKTVNWETNLTGIIATNQRRKKLKEFEKLKNQDNKEPVNNN